MPLFKKPPTTFGSARFATKKEIKRSGLYTAEGVVLGIDKKGYYLTHNGPEHIKVIAPTRSGKGVGIVIPTLLSWSESVIIYDIKGENWDVTAGYRATFSKCIYFNPTENTSNSFNPLMEVRKGEFEVRDVQNIADMIVDPDGRGMTDHWAKTGHSLLVGAILHVLYIENDKTLSGVADLLSNPEMTLTETLEMMLEASHLKGGVTHPVVAATARDMLNKAENERSGVLSTAMSFLSLYRDPIIRKNTATSDFKILDLVEADTPYSLYIAVPPSDISRVKPLIRLILNQVSRRLTETLPKKGERKRLLMLLDEFPALGHLSFFESALGFLAGYGIKCLLVSQSINQIEKAYGVNNSILENSHIKVFFTPNTIKTADVVSRMLGDKTERKEKGSYSRSFLSLIPGNTSYSMHETQRKLLTPDEVMTLNESNSLIFLSGLSPIKAKKLFYYKDKNFHKRLIEKPVLASSQCSVISNESEGKRGGEKILSSEKIQQELSEVEELLEDYEEIYEIDREPEVAI